MKSFTNYIKEHGYEGSFDLAMGENPAELELKKHIAAVVHKKQHVIKMRYKMGDRFSDITSALFPDKLKWPEEVRDWYRELMQPILQSVADEREAHIRGHHIAPSELPDLRSQGDDPVAYMKNVVRPGRAASQDQRNQELRTAWEKKNTDKYMEKLRARWAKEDAEAEAAYLNPNS